MTEERRIRAQRSEPSDPGLSLRKRRRWWAGEDTPPGNQQQEGGEEEQFDPKRAMETIRAQRENEKALKKKAADAERALDEMKKQIERDKLSAEDKVKADLAEFQGRATAAETAARENEVKLKVFSQAVRLGFHDPEDAWKMVDLATVSDETLGDTLKALLQAKPYLARSETGGGTNGKNGNGAGAGSVSTGNPASAGALTKEQIEKMTPQQVIANLASVKAALKNIR